ncbi:hypothetical protein HG530_008105 [Fusarium avenaceum]|nr:hypothetical protein HG530_008105 [Fusarium avenaceum]
MPRQSLKRKSEVFLTAVESFADKHIRCRVWTEKIGCVHFFSGILKLNLVNLLRKLKAKLETLFGTKTLVFYIFKRRFVYFGTNEGPGGESIKLLLHVLQVRKAESDDDCGLVSNELLSEAFNSVSASVCYQLELEVLACTAALLQRYFEGGKVHFNVSTRCLREVLEHDTQLS